MASAQVRVRVVDGPETVLENARRPVRLAPDGWASVVYVGAAYPLYDGDFIDIAGPSWEIEDCNRFLLAGVRIPYAPTSAGGERHNVAGQFVGDWHVETNHFGHHVMFNASESVAAHVVDAIEDAGLAIQRWDVSHRTADDGRFYDWFARLLFQGSHDECLSLVTEALRPDLREPTPALDAEPAAIEPSRNPTSRPIRAGQLLSNVPETTQSRLEQLVIQIEHLSGQVVELNERLSGTLQESANLRLELEQSLATQARMSAEAARAQSHQRALREEIAALRESDGLDEATRDLLAKQSESEELLEFALAENSELHEQVGGLRSQRVSDRLEVDNLNAMLEDLRGRIAEVSQQDKERRRAIAPRRAPRMGLEAFLGRTYRRTEFVLDSLDVVAGFESPAAVLRILDQIERGERVGRDIASARGWSEVSKVATGIAGSEDMGRVYYKPVGDAVLLCVHIKQNDNEQRRVFERLRDIA